MADPIEAADGPAKPSFVVHKYVDAAQLKRDLAINPSEVGNAMLEHASRTIEYGVKLAQAGKQADTVKMLLEAVEAKVDKSIRNTHAAAGAKVTESAIEKEMRLHPKVIAYRKLLNEARQIETLAKSAVDAFRQRKDMLVSFGMLQREEMRGEVSVNRRQAVEAEQEGLRERTLARLGKGALAE